MKEKVRIHLKQAILVGYGDEAKYVKVLVGERDTTLYGQTQARTRSRSTPFVIFGFVRGYQGFTLAGGPIRMWVEDDNILAIEEARVEQPTRTTWTRPPVYGPQTVNEHAKRIIRLVSFSAAYGGEPFAAAQRVQEHLERYFRLTSERQ